LDFLKLLGYPRSYLLEGCICQNNNNKKENQKYGLGCLPINNGRAHINVHLIDYLWTFFAHKYSNVLIKRLLFKIRCCDSWIRYESMWPLEVLLQYN
jgi:hypothetical protein